VNTELTNSFLRDMRKLPDDVVRAQVRATIEAVEVAADLSAVSSLEHPCMAPVSLDTVS